MRRDAAVHGRLDNNTHTVAIVSRVALGLGRTRGPCSLVISTLFAAWDSLYMYVSKLTLEPFTMAEPPLLTVHRIH